jgi:membrane-associated phospholipid phosphatase
MPLLALDRCIAFLPAALPVYLSLWLYVSLAPALLVGRRELATYGFSATALAAIGLGIFFIWPTAVPRLETDAGRMFDLLHNVDASGNACPSLHAAFTTFTALWLDCVLREVRARFPLRAINWLWCAGILYSTVAVRQHVVLDLLAGTALGAVTGIVALARLRVSNSTTNRA